MRISEREISKRILIILLILFIILPSLCFAKEINEEDLEEYVQLPSFDSKNILKKLPQALTNYWIDLITSAEDEERQAVSVIVRRSVQKDYANYLLKQAPMEILIELSKVGSQIIKFSLTSDVSGVIAEFEKATVKEAKEYLIEWLVENEVKVSFGELDVQYDSLKEGRVTETFQYIIFYQPITNELGEIKLFIYSSEEIEPPLEKGDPWSLTLNTFWLPSQKFLQGEKISPFILSLEGKAKREKSGYWGGEINHKYSWIKKPKLEIKFPEEVPHFEFTKQTFWEKITSGVRDRLKKIGTAFEKAGGGITSGLSNLIDGIRGLIKKLSGSAGPILEASIEGENEDKDSSYELDELREAIRHLEELLSQEKEEGDDLREELEKLRDRLQEIESEKFNEQKNKEDNETEEENQDLENENQEDLSPILISEVCSGLDTATNEFIELYNPNDFSIEINNDNFQLELVNSTNKITKKKINWIRNTIPSKGYFLLVGGELNLDQISPDAIFSSQLTSISGVIISDRQDNHFDKVGWGSSVDSGPESAVEEDDKTISTGLLTGSSIERNLLIDTDNNELDFVLTNQPNPENSLGEKAVYNKADQNTYFPPGGVTNGENNGNEGENQEEDEEEEQQEEEESPEICTAENILITEVEINGDEYVEIYNLNNETIDLSYCYLSYFSSGKGWNNPTRSWEFLEGLEILPSSYLLIGIYILEDSTLSVDWQTLTQGGSPYSIPQISENGAIGIFLSDPKLEDTELAVQDGKIDLVGWGDVLVSETEPTISPGEGEVISRKLIIDGDSLIYQDTDNNLEDFEARGPTPKSQNEHDYLDIDEDNIVDEIDPEVEIRSVFTLMPGEYIFHNLVVRENVSLILKSDVESEEEFKGVRIIAENITIEEGGLITATGEGYAANQGLGAGDYGSGGAYGGRGAGDNTIEVDSLYGEGGSTYGSPYQPIDLGSGGGDCQGEIGGGGGGAMFLEVSDTLTVDGEIVSNGEESVYPAGSGSGGSIYIVTEELIGTGYIYANGGDSGGAAGGGGRIAIYYSINDFPEENIYTYGGDGSNEFNGGTGTIFLKSSSESGGDLVIRSGEVPTGATTSFKKLETALERLEILNLSHVYIEDTLNNFTANEIYIDNSILETEGEVTINSTQIFSYKSSLVVPSQVYVNINGGNIFLNDDSSFNGNFNIISDSLIIDNTSTISARGKGYLGDEGPGAGDMASGGGYGGLGGGDYIGEDLSVYGIKGSTYGNQENPVDFGSGGGSYRGIGGSGGGFIKIENSGNLTVEGSISSNGNGGSPPPNGIHYYGGGGAGGTIHISTDVLLGSGTISADGGGIDRSCGGGGGRIAVYYENISDFLGSTQAHGGTGSPNSQEYQGEGGTIWMKQKSSPYGELYLGEVM